jgi:hypothetical protein
MNIMAIAPLTAKQQQLIVSNIVKACKDINKLSKSGYNFIYLASGFIAHNDINGFIAAHDDGSLKRKIKENARFNMWSNFREGETNYEYYMSKKAVYQAIMEKI